MKTYLRMLVGCVAVVLAMAVVVGSNEARGAGEDKPAAVDKARARMEKGQALFAQGRYGEAAQEFEAAYAALPYGAFLYNAALAAEKGLDLRRALVQYQKFLKNHPDAPDADRVRKTITRLEADVKAADEAAAAGPTAGDAGPGADGGAAGDAGVAEAPPKPADAETMAEVRSLVFIESDPPGAPLAIYERTDPSAGPFARTGTNPGWAKIIGGTRTPRDLSLKVGHYHVVIEGFSDYKRSETNISLAPGHVYTFKANLSQGEFLGFLDVKSKVEGAAIYVDDPPPHEHAPWGRTPHSALLGQGEHDVYVSAPGYQPFTAKVKIAHGKTATLEAALERLDFGIVRIDGNAEEVEVEIDGKEHGIWRAGEQPLQIKLPPGKHQLVLDASGRNTYEGEIDVPAGQALDVRAALVESKDWVKPIIMTLVAGAAIGGGFGMYTAADSKQEELDDLKTTEKYLIADQLTVNDADKLEDEEAIFRGFGTGLFIGAGVIGAAAIFFFIYDPTDDSIAKKGAPRELKDDEAKESARFTPRITPLVGLNGGGLGLSGVF